MIRSGACLCGAVTFKTVAEPLMVRTCWCRDCQRVNSGSPSHNAFFRTQDVTLDGELRWHDVTADSGNLLGRGFCPECGTQVAVQSHARRHLMAVRLGLFDPSDELAPQAIIWTASAPAWAHLDPDLPQFEQQPPPVSASS